jgi:hypothetical protein
LTEGCYICRQYYNHDPGTKKTFPS